MFKIQQKKTDLPRHLLIVREVAACAHLGRSTIYEIVQGGAFPAPVKLGARAVAWIESEVEHWIQSRTFHRAVIRRSKIYPGEISAGFESSEIVQPVDEPSEDDSYAQGP